jgi:hypothetical protein
MRVMLLVFRVIARRPSVAARSVLARAFNHAARAVDVPLQTSNITRRHKPSILYISQ